MNLYSQSDSSWWVGVVENRNDPEHLGRCKVRIFGYHTENMSDLPTDDLPWAIPMTPITSASSSGVGTAPVGPVEGTWIIGFFLDGEDRQQPLMVGTINGKPSIDESLPIKEDIPPNALTDSSGNVVRDSENNPIIVTEEAAPPIVTGSGISSEIKTTLPPLSVSEVQDYFDSISSDAATNSSNSERIGKYNFDARILIDNGYIRTPQNINAGIDSAILDIDSNWVGKDNIKSKSDFLASLNIQDNLMYAVTYKNYKKLLSDGTIKISDSKSTVAGFLSASHYTNTTNAIKAGLTDKSGKTTEEYFSIGNAALGGDGKYPTPITEVPNRETYVGTNPNNTTNDPLKSLNDPALASAKGFRDPNKVYPKKDYNNKVDTNKLAYGDDDTPLTKNKLKNRITNVSTANSSKIWSQPENPYSAKYPYNQVTETESGHVIELDNTPGKERIHVYHKSGTYIEVDVNGSMVRKVVGDSYEVIDRNGHLYVKGALNITTEGATKIQVKDNADIEVFGETHVVGHRGIAIDAANKVVVNANTGIDLYSPAAININSNDKVNIKGTSIVLEATAGDIVHTAPNNIIVQANKFSAKVSSTSLDGTVNMSDGSATAGYKTGLSSDAGIFINTPLKTPNTVELENLIAPVAKEDTFTSETPEESSPEKRKAETESGAIIEASPSTTPAESANTAPLPAVTPPSEICECEEFATYKYFPDTIRLSKYYTLGALTTRTPAASYELRDNRGLTKAQIACNLKTLAVNCLDRIKDKYPDMLITNSFRAKGGPSDHEIGCAADLQFTKHSFTDYHEIVNWIRENIINTQLLLEYQARSSGQICWIHISYNKNSGAKPLHYATFYNNKVHTKNQFINLA
jgi:hypothetical protein